MENVAPSPALLQFAKVKLSNRLMIQHGDKSELWIRKTLDTKMAALAAMTQDQLSKDLLSQLAPDEFVIC